MFKVPHQAYTAEFKAAAVKRVKDGQAVAVVSRELGMSGQTLRNWVKASDAGTLNGTGSKAVTPMRRCTWRAHRSSPRQLMHPPRWSSHKHLLD